MDNKIKLVNNDNNIINCDILIRFEYDGNRYIVYTDNKCNMDGEYNLYKALINKDNKLIDSYDNKVNYIFDKLICEYKKKVIKGEL